MAPHSSTLPWKIPWMEEPGRLRSMGSLRVRHDWVTTLSLFTFMHWRRKWQPHSSVLAWRIPRMGEPGGLPSMGWHRVRHDWSNLAAAAAGWDGWMASPTPWTWVWVDSGSWWWTGRPGLLRFMGSHRVIQDWVTELINTKNLLWARHQNL